MTPHSTTGVPPSELLFGRNLRTRLDMLRPDVGGRVRDKQSQQKEYHDQHSTTRVFHIGDAVWVQNLRDGPRWVPGVVTDQLGPLSYMVRVSGGSLWRRHVDHIRIGTTQPDDSERVENSSDELIPPLAGSDEAPESGTPPDCGENPMQQELTEQDSRPVVPSSSNRYPIQI